MSFGLIISLPSIVRMHFKLPAIFLLCLVLMAASSFASQPTWVGVEIRSFAQAKENPDVIYATDSVALFRSSDRGQSWEPLRTPNGGVYQKVSVVPENHQHLVLWGEGFTQNPSLEYLESIDGGNTWKSKVLPISQSTGIDSSTKPQLTDLLIDPIEHGGAWWVVAGRQLYRSADKGSTWKLNSENVQKKILIVHTENSTYWLSENTLFRSSDLGVTWSKQHEFPSAGEAKEVYATDLWRLSSGELVARVNNVWFRTQGNRGTMAVEVDGLSSLPDQQKTPRTDRQPDKSNWYCRIRQAEGLPDSLFAFCAWDNRSWPSSLCLYRSQDGGNTWTRPSDKSTRCHPDLPSWSPVAIWMDRADPNILLASWMAGGVYRSQDGGVSWTRSDQGLLFRTPNHQVAFAAIYEPPLIRAVIERDKATLGKLLLDGVDINSPGNKLRGVLEADLIALEYSRQIDTNTSLYGYLRSKGAIPLPRAHGTEGLMSRVCRFTLDTVVEDLIKFGYDWAHLTSSDLSPQTSSELSDCIGSISLRDPNDARRILDRWINLYISTGKFPSADQTVLDLFNAKRPDLAFKVLKSASKRTAFDAQSTPPSPSRIAIVPELWNLEQYGWAKRVFLASSVDDKSPSATDFLLSLAFFCKPEIVEWYVAKGFPVSYSLCLGNAEINLEKRIRMLGVMDARGEIDKADWLKLLNDPDTRWVEKTSQYRRHTSEIEPLRGLIGIGYQTRGDKLVIVELTDGYPAQGSGLMAGDEITGIDGIALTPQTMEKLASKIRGKPGTTVTLDIRRAGEDLRFTLRRKRWP